MRNRLKRWWHIEPLWLACFCILFGMDAAKIDFEKPLDLFTLIDSFADGGKAKIVYSDVLPVLTAMLKAGIAAIVTESAPGSFANSEKRREASSQHPQPSPNMMQSFSLDDSHRVQGE